MEQEIPVPACFFLGGYYFTCWGGVALYGCFENLSAFFSGWASYFYSLLQNICIYF